MFLTELKYPNKTKKTFYTLFGTWCEFPNLALAWQRLNNTLHVPNDVLDDRHR